jgi:hypothetical protein
MPLTWQGWLIWLIGVLSVAATAPFHGDEILATRAGIMVLLLGVAYFTLERRS